MEFSIITPSFQSSSWLKLCIASVADQGISLEHIIQDAGSDDGTLDWLLADKRVKPFVEKDRGMYDGINRGLRRAQGELLAYLNCDEQYLPGTLSEVAAFFRTNPALDVVFGDVVVVGSDGHYLYHRKMQTPLKYHTWLCHLSTLSCATFFRRRVIFDYGFYFEPQWRMGGDAEWMVRMLRKRVSMATLSRFTSAFTETGVNRGASPEARRESRELASRAPPWARWLKPLFIAHHRLRRLTGGMYRQNAFSYAIYTHQSPNARHSFDAATPTWRRSSPGNRPLAG